MADPEQVELDGRQVTKVGAEARAVDPDGLAGRLFEPARLLNITA